ncbi:hypothetical protein CK203_077764 [Vitis vinifera]|uniref:DUF4283 domain-containing protein n=1 Tax=Vitis vinifera TaxID=29760 RepID=A0A438BXA9_VITVI|nr:hypothetical protein CK203_077764 [Vitis vinifera]
MGLNSVGLFMEGLQQCIEDMRVGSWEKRWKEKGEASPWCEYLTGRVASCGGLDGDGGSVAPDGYHCWQKVQQEEVRALGRPRPEMVKGRSFADMVKGWGDKEPNTIQVEVGREELSRNLSRLEHCLIGSWNPSNEKGEDLENLGWKMAKAWGLRAWVKDELYWNLSSWKKQEGFTCLVIRWWEVCKWG